MRAQLRKLILLLLLLDISLATLYVSQWPRWLEVPSGSNVTLQCEVLGLTEPRMIIYPYWVVGGTEEEGEERVVYPPPEGSRQQDALPESEIGTGLSLQLRHLRPSHSNTYRCLASVHLPDRRLLLRGNGTVLLVRGSPREPLPFYILLVLKALILLFLTTVYQLPKSNSEPAHRAPPGGHSVKCGL